VAAALFSNIVKIRFKHDVITFISKTNFTKPADFATTMTNMLHVFPRTVELNILHNTLFYRS